MTIDYHDLFVNLAFHKTSDIYYYIPRELNKSSFENNNSTKCVIYVSYFQTNFSSYLNEIVLHQFHHRANYFLGVDPTLCSCLLGKFGHHIHHLSQQDWYLNIGQRDYKGTLQLIIHIMMCIFCNAENSENAVIFSCLYMSLYCHSFEPSTKEIV